MGDYLRIIGAIAVILAFLLLSGAYTSYIRQRASEYSAFLVFLELMRREISSSLCTAGELGARSNDEALEKLGFLSALRRGERIVDAFDKTADKSLLSKEDRASLRRYFADFGLGTLTSELRTLEGCIVAFSVCEREERENAPKRTRLATTLLLLFGLAVTVLLI